MCLQINFSFCTYETHKIQFSIATIDYDSDDIESYLYQIKGNTISLIDGSWVINYNIEKLTNKELVITHPIDRYIYDSDSDSNVYFEGIARVHYKKQ